MSTESYATYSKSDYTNQFFDQLISDDPTMTNQRREVKNAVTGERTRETVRKICQFIIAKVSLALQLIPAFPVGIIVAPILEVGRSIDFLVDAIRNIRALSRQRENLKSSDLPEDYKKLCLAKLDQDSFTAWGSIWENAAYLGLAVTRVVLTAAVITAVVGSSATGVGLSIVMGAGVGLMIVANVARFAIELFKRPNSTLLDLKGNGLKLFWHSTVVLTYRENRLESERKRLFDKYAALAEKDPNFTRCLALEDVLRDINFYNEKKEALLETKKRIKEIQKAYRKAGVEDFALMQQRVSSEAQVVAEPLENNDLVKNFTVEKYEQFTPSQKAAFQQLFMVNPDKIKKDENYLKRKLEKWLSGFSIEDMIDKEELGNRLLKVDGKNPQRIIVAA